MKKLLFIFLLTISINAKAQTPQDWHFYLGYGLNIGNQTGFDFDLTQVYKEKLSVQLKYSYHQYVPATRPEDYQSGRFLDLDLFHHDDQSRMETVAVLFGKIKKLNARGTKRLNLKAGLGYTKLFIPYNWQKDNVSWGRNYTYDIRTEHRFSILLNPELEIPFTRNVGFALSPYLQANGLEVAYGGQIKLQVGFLRNKTVRKK